MNTQLVDSLVQTILSLSVEERRLFDQRLQETTSASPPSKPINLKNNPFFGLWHDREDMQDSVQWVRNLRHTEWEMSRE